jgi:hypothetical protein
LEEAAFENVEVGVQKRSFGCGSAAVFAGKVLYMPLTHIQTGFWSKEDRERCGHLVVGGCRVVGENLRDFGDGEAVVATGRKK